MINTFEKNLVRLIKIISVQLLLSIKCTINHINYFKFVCFHHEYIYKGCANIQKNVENKNSIDKPDLNKLNQILHK